MPSAWPRPPDATGARANTSPSTATTCPGVQSIVTRCTASSVSPASASVMGCFGPLITEFGTVKPTHVSRASDSMTARRQTVSEIADAYLSAPSPSSLYSLGCLRLR